MAAQCSETKNMNGNHTGFLVMGIASLGGSSAWAGRNDTENITLFPLFNLPDGTLLTTQWTEWVGLRPYRLGEVGLSWI